MDNLESILEWLKSFWNAEIVKLGETPLTIKSLIIVLVSLILLVYLSGKLKKLLVKRIFPRYDLDIGVSQSVAIIIRYVLVILGAYIIFQTSGIDLSALGLLIGALGIGIGFGLQNVTNNFISGIIILF